MDTVWGALRFLLKRNFDHGGVSVTSLSQKFDEKGPAKLHFSSVPQTYGQNGICLMLIESRLKRATDPFVI